MEMFSGYNASPIGLLSISADANHITSILFCDKAAESENKENDLIDCCKQQLHEYFAGQRRQFDFPMQQSGTPFQQKVWNLLSKIPFGKTISYHDLSKQYGDVKAIRAVASANGKNSLSIVVPCHRVIGKDQSLTGYAGGLWRKRWLLEHEAKHFGGVRELEW